MTVTPRVTAEPIEPAESGGAVDPAGRVGPSAAPAGIVLGLASRLRGTLALPSDKSIAHRALLANAIAAGEAVVTIRSPGDDVLSTASALRSLGVQIGVTSSGSSRLFRIRGQGSPSAVGALQAGTADCGNSGTTMRLLCGIATFGSGRIMLTGDVSLSRRPMERVAVPLRQMWARVATTDGHAPLTIDGRRPLAGKAHSLPVASAQVLGAICFAALAADGVTTVAVPGATRDHSERLLAAMGADIHRVDVATGTVTTMRGPGRLRAASFTVPADLSSAAAWLVAATIHPDAELHLTGVGLNPTRLALLDVLREMGADITVVPSKQPQGPEPVGDLIVRSAAHLRAVSIRGDRVPALIDELPLLAVAMAAAQGTSEVRDAGELRVKESDRISAMAAALIAAGARVEEHADGWRITPGRARDAAVTTHGDHRVAIAMAVAAWSGVAKSVTMDDAACVAVSYPTFWEDAAAVGALPGSEPLPGNEARPR